MPSFQQVADRRGTDRSADNVRVSRDQQVPGDGDERGEKPRQYINAPLQLEHQQADEHAGQGVVDAQCPLGDKLADQGTADGGHDPDAVGQVIDDQGPVSVPAPFTEACQVDGEALISDAIGIESQESAADPLQVNGKGRAHEDMPEIDDEGRQYDGRRRCSCCDHGNTDKLCAPGKHQDRHHRHGPPWQPGLLGQHSQRQADGEITETDRPGGVGAVTQDSCRYFCFGVEISVVHCSKVTQILNTFNGSLQVENLK